jgi:hypothetical protein
MYYYIGTEAINPKRDKIMTNLNTKANRAAILNRIEKDGVSLKEFSKDQKIEIIKTYAAVCLRDGDI